MCVALPGLVCAIDGDTALVDFNGNKVKVNLGLVDARVGDYVLVHAGMAIEVMKKDSAQELLEIFKELEAEAYDRD